MAMTNDNLTIADSSFDESECLKFDPFDGDFGNPSDRILKNKIVTARKAGTCHMCTLETKPTERVRVLAAIFDGEMKNYRWCSACCRAMALVWSGDWQTMEDRFAIRREGKT